MNMLETVLNFVTSQPAGIFALLFLNNILMYLVAKRHFNKAWVKQEQQHRDVVKWASHQEKALRAVIHAFGDEAAGAPMPLFECEESGFHLCDEAQSEHVWKPGTTTC
jgi:hypothetical protein